VLSGAAGSGVLFEPDAPLDCLLGKTGRCDWNRSCDYHSYSSTCLQSRVPIGSLSADDVSCCLKCCLSHFQSSHSISNNETAIDTLNAAQGLNIATSDESHLLLASTSNLLRSASAVLMKATGIIGARQFQSYEFATVYKANEADMRIMQGRRLILINARYVCTSLTTVQHMMKRVEHASNPFVHMYYTQQPPCSPPVSSDGSSTITPSLRKFMESSQWKERIRLLPVGVRSTLAASKALSTPDFDRSSQTRDLLLDCSCARQSGNMKRIMSQYPSLPCSYDGGSPDISPHDVNESDSSHISTLSEYYQRLHRYKFILSPSDLNMLSHCEWEAMAFGAVPLLSHSLTTDERTRTLFSDLPLYFIKPNITTDSAYLTKIFDHVRKLFSDSYSLSKLYYPYWHGELLRFTIHGKAPQRLWDHVGDHIQSIRISNCSMVDNRIPYDLKNFGRIGAPPGLLSASVGKTLPKNGRISPRASRGKHLPNTRSTYTSRKLGGYDPMKYYGYTNPSPNGTTHVSDFDSRMLAAVSPPPSKNLLHTSLARDRRTDLELELVLPRCCEEGPIEFDWLFDVLSTLSSKAAAALYYKCPFCLPASKAKEWLHGDENGLRESDFEKKRTITLLDDEPLLAFGDRVTQRHCIDRVYNGKEVTAYLTHIVDYYDTLADQTIFLHTSPHAHIHFPLFYRLLAWSEQCRHESPPVHFVHLNVHYKTVPSWASCCGCAGVPGACRHGTWNYLFQDYKFMGPVYDYAHTYSSAQFAVSRKAIHMWPRSFYERMLAGINGSYDIPGCCNTTTKDPWGGHSLTGQYERMWHMIFGHFHIQQRRVKDNSIPSILHLDCSPHDSKCFVGAL